jgi:hypothetical protein
MPAPEINPIEIAAKATYTSPKHAAKKNRQAVSVFLSAVLVAGFIAIAPTPDEPAEASTISSQSRTYSFNSPNELTEQFDAFGAARAKVTQSTDRGIGGTGSVFVQDASTVDTFGVYKAKDGYSLGPVGSTYTFETYFKSFGLNGWSGMGFTTQDQTMTLATLPAVSGAGVPNDAIGVSVAGSEFRFHRANLGDTQLNWQQGSLTAPDISASCVQPIHRNREAVGSPHNITSDRVTCASVDGWYKMILEIERTAELTFKLTAKLWDSNSAGVVRPTTPEADRSTPLAQRSITFTLASNSPFITAPQMFSYFNFSGQRFESFDGYGVTLSGGATVVQNGFPVVLTSAAQASGSAIRVSGNVTRVVGSVQERGFVYSTTPDPDIADTKVPYATPNTGSFEVASAPVAAGTYYVRAFATDNASKTSYGVQKTVNISSSNNSSAPVGSSPASAVLTAPRAPLPTEVKISNEANALRVNLGFTGTETSKPASYNVTLSPGGATCRVNSDKGFCDIPGVKRGVEYSISVTAVNSVGSSKPSVVYNRVLLGSSGWLTYANRASLDNFAGNSPKVTRQIRSKAMAFARNNPQIDYVSCVGFAAGNVANERQFNLALTRAKRICDQLKKVNPDLETNVSSRVPGSAFSGANRKVLVTGYSPIS